MSRHKKEAGTRGGWNVSISGVFIAMVMAIVLISAVASALIFVQLYRNAMEQSAVTSSSQSCEQVQNTVENYTQDMQIMMGQIVARMRYENDQADEYIQNMVSIRSDVVAVTLFDEDGKLLRYWNSGQTLKENYRGMQQDKTKKDDDRLHITKPYVESLFEGYYPWVVTVYQKVQKRDGTNIQINVDIRFSDIANYIDDVGIGQHGYAYIADKSGNLIYHPQQQLIYSGLKEEKGIDLEEGTHVQEQVIYTVKDLDNCDWKIVGVCYVDEMITEKVSSAVSRLLIMLCGVMAAVFLLGWAFSELFSAPVRQLAKDMHRFEKDAENFVFEPMKGTTEITTLSNSFEHMVVKIQKLMEQVRQEEITLRKTELKALQAQINPHFLYNTLDAIAWMCEDGKNEDAEEMVTALARLFRISISKGHELIPIEKEVEHAKSYLKIENYRYKNKFAYSFEVEEACLSYLCNKITLQPIIENAIYHGVKQMIDEGEIQIRIFQEGEDIIFQVEDNGIGMTEEQCQEILRKEPGDRTGIGIKNVNDRIQIYFGNKYGLHITSELDEGTCVTIRMPKVREEEYERK